MVPSPSLAALGACPTDRTIVETLQKRACENADRQIYHLVDDTLFDVDRPATASLTYGDVDRRARAIAATLAERLTPGNRVLLAFNVGLEFMPAFYGCIYAGMIPVPVYPPNRGFTADPLAGLRGIQRDCQPAAGITGGTVANGVMKLTGEDGALSSLWWITTESIDVSRGDDWVGPDINPSDVALLQYTSGSTGSPRGVMVTHENLISNQQVIRLAFAHVTRARPEGSVVCWLPFHHDMGLMGNVIQPLFVDSPVYFLSPLDFLRKPLRWLQVISHLGPVGSGGPGFAYDLCTHRITEEEKATLDLSRWEGAYVGADRISPSTIRRFSEAFESCGFSSRSFYPCYGLAEATLFVTGGDYREEPTVRSFRPQEYRPSASDDIRFLSDPAPFPERRTLVGCGTPWTDHEVVIVDPETRAECAEGEAGEIWVLGPSVAQGYWNQPKATEEVFQATIQGDSRGPFLRTGDIGFLDHSELFIAGRLKDVIIIRGSNHYPEDIEAAVTTLHDAFLPASTAAIGRTVDGGEELVLLQEVARKTLDFDATPVRKAIRRRIAEEFQIQTADIVFVTNGSLPKTSSGKIRRSVCRHQYQAGTLQRWKAPSAR